MRREKKSLRRNCIESALISQISTIKLRPVSYRIIIKAVVAQCDIQANREKKRSSLCGLILTPEVINNFNMSRGETIYCC